MSEFVRELPKAELHLHIEGTLEPSMLLSLSARNHVPLRYSSVDEIEEAFQFTNLQSFLDVYYEAARTLLTRRDFFDLTSAYLERAAADGVVHAEIFFDPQTHTERGVPLDAVIGGIADALAAGRAELGLSSGLILCFLRHLPAGRAMDTLEAALPFREQLLGVGLDSSEVGNPPGAFAGVFAAARDEGLRLVAHAGEEGPPEYVWEALDVLGAERIDHGNRALEDPELVARLVTEQVPLTVCPYSNVKLAVVDRLEDHPLRRMIDLGLNVSINSDDPSYFGGYIGDNYEGTKAALRFSDDEMAEIARNSLLASFVPDDEKQALIADLDEFLSHRP
ncbi:MAG: adenosine deaminase [Acidimicrobiia bacterium]|nr:adenosine deaminase [Acidimicrobiia bacterium]